MTASNDQLSAKKNFVLSGRHNYYSLAQNIGGPNELFLDLANRFDFFANLLTELRLFFDQPVKDMISLYMLWLETGDETARKKFLALGINPVSPPITRN